MAKRFKQSVVDAVPHLNETKERWAEKGAGVSTADASSAKSGSGKRFKPSAVEAIQPKIQTASSFATVNKAAPAYEQYKEVTEGLEAGQKKLDRFREELETLRSAYTALPTEANAKAYNHRLEQFNNDLKEYNGLVEQYNYFNSAEGIKARVDELTPLVEAAEKERNGARTVLSGLSRYGTEDQRVAWSAKLVAAEADYETYSKELDGLAAQYYYTENQAKRERLDADEAMANAYSSAKTLQEDMEKVAAVMAYATYKSGEPEQVQAYTEYLKKKYGLDQKAIDQYAISGAAGGARRQGEGYGNIYELYQELERQKAGAVDRLAGADYDYERMAEYEQMLADAEEYARKQQEWETWAKEHPVLSSIDSVLMSPFQGVDYLKTMAGGIGHSDTGNLETYVPMNVYNMDATNYVSTVRSTVSKTIEEHTDWELFGQNVASFLYQTGMSVADSATQVAAFGSAATLFMGASAASNQAKYVIERGGTNEQAFWGGLAAGAAEVIFEKASIDQLLKPKTVAGMKDLLRETVQQAGVEASEEMLTEISNILTDVAIMGEQSDFQSLVNQYMLQGMSKEDAKRQAVLDCIGQVAWAGAGGALSGAAMGGTVNTFHYYAGNGVAARNTRNLGQQFQQMGGDVVAAIIQEGLASDPSTGSYQMARKLQEKVDAGKTVTAQELGQLYQANVETISQEQETGAETEGADAQAIQNPALRARQQLLDRAAVEEQQRQAAAQQQETVDNRQSIPAEQASVVGALRQEQPALEVQPPEAVGTETQETRAVAQEGLGVIQNPVLAARQALLDQADRQAAGEAQQQEELQGLTLPELEKTASARPANMEPITAERVEQSDGQQGEDIPSGGQGRISGTGTGAQAGGLGEGTGQSGRASEQFRAASSRQDRVNALRQERVSSLELGISQGTAEKVVQTVPEAVWDEGMRATADRVYQETGLPVTYVIGGLQIEAPDGVRLIRGVYTGEGIIIQADNLRLTTDQIADHEIFHDKAFQAPGLVGEIKARILERFGAEEFEQVVKTYAQKLRGVIDVPENASDEVVDAAIRNILEEIFADAYAGINAFSAHAEQYHEVVKQTLEEQESGRNREVGAATDRTTGPPGDSVKAAPGGLSLPSLDELDSRPAAGYDDDRRENRQGEIRDGKDSAAAGEADTSDWENKDSGIRPDLTAEEEAALLEYKSGGSYMLNAAIRDGGPLSQEQYRMAEALDTALEKLPAYQGTVYRRLGFDSIGGQMALDAFLEEHRAGKLIQYPAFTSSSTDPEGYPVDGDLTITIVIKGQNGRNLDGFGNNFEQEITFPRNSKFFIDRMEADTQGKPVIYMREVTKHGTGQLYSQELGQAVQQVQKEKLGETVYLPGVPGVDPGRDADGGLPGLRTGRAESEGTRGMEEGSQEDDGRNGRARKEASVGEDGLSLPKLREAEDHGNETRFSVEDEADGQAEPRRDRGSGTQDQEGGKKIQTRKRLRLEDFDTVDEYTAALEERAALEKAERMKNLSKEDFVGTPALERLGVKVENSVGIYDFIPSLLENDRAAKSIRRELHRAERRLNATPAERNFASGVAAGIYAQEDIPSTMDTDKVMELADYYWAERAVSADLIRQQRTDINQALSEKMRELFKDSDAFKPSKAIVLNHRTPERNMLHIFGDERGAAINAEIFDPVAVNEAERFRFRNRMHDEVRAFEDSTGKSTRLTKEERAVVQQVIEGRAIGEIVAGMEVSSAIQNAAENIRNGEDPGDAAKEFGLDQKQRRLAEQYSRWLQTQEILDSGRVDNVKVEHAVKKYTELFDQFYAAINDFLVAHGYEPIGFIKGYAPHLQPESNRNILNKSLQAIGINTDVTRLPSSIAGLTADYRPNKRWNPYFLQRTSDITQYDIATAFESYVEYMSDVLYHTDDIMRVRQAANYFRRTYAPDEIRENLSWAEELRYRNTDEKAAFLRDHDVISQTSVMTPGDINQAMDDYVDQLYKNITHTAKYSELVSYLDNYANILAGKQSMADRGWEYSSGRTILNLGNKLVRAFGRAQVAGNLSSALNQTAQLPQIFAELGIKNTAQAIADIWIGKLRRASWAQESDFLTGKKGINYLVTDPADMVVSALFKPAEFVDGFVSTVAVRGRYLQEIQEGKSEREAMKAADAWGKSVMGSRAKGSKPLAFEAKNPVAQMANVFQVEALNSWEHLIQDLPRDFRAIEQSRGKKAAAAALAGVIVKMLLAAFLLNRATEETYGGTPAPFDILGLSANFIASGEGLTTNEWLRTVMDNGWERLTGERLFDTDPEALGGDFNWSAAAADLSYNTSNDIPYLRNAAGLLGLGDETLPLPDLYGAGEGIANAITDDGLLSLDTLAAIGAAVTELLPGGRQTAKTVQGLTTILRGGRYYGYGDQARLQYPVEGDFFDVVRALMFGNSALEETNAFYASGESGLSAAQTQLYNDLVHAGADSAELYRGIQDYRAVNRDDNLSSLEKGKQERDIIKALNLTDGQKLDLYRGLTGADSRAEKFQAIMDIGMNWDEVMDAYDRYAELDADKELKATDKATELARWADEKYPEDQATAIKEQLTFFSIIPAQAERYTALTEAGLDAESAYNLTEIFAGLEPEEGADTVSKMQRYHAVVTSDLSDQEQLTALGTLMEESEFSKAETGYEFGISPALYIQTRESVAKIDEDGSTSQDEATMAINSLPGLTGRERAILWQLQDKGWKAKNNPFSVRVGQEVYDALHADDEPERVELPRLDLQEESTDIPAISLPRLN